MLLVAVPAMAQEPAGDVVDSETAVTVPANSLIVDPAPLDTEWWTIPSINGLAVIGVAIFTLGVLYRRRMAKDEPEPAAS